MDDNCLRSSKLNFVKRFQTMNPEKFATLCRMHLSFALDLGDAAFSVLLESKDSNKTKKGFHFHRKHKTKGVMEGANLTQEGVCQVYQLIEYLGRDSNVCQEGLFRKTGNLSRQQDLKNLLNSGVTVDLESGQYNVHDCACVLKNFLSELPEPLLTEAHFLLHCQVPDISREGMLPEEKQQAYQRQLKVVQLLFLLLQPESYSLVKDLLHLLHHVSISRKTNCMDAASLATVFAPHILCPKKMPPQELRRKFPCIIKAATFMIENAHNLFEPPNELLQDIFTCLKYSNGVNLSSNSSISDSESEAVQTVITFCDRNKAKENSTDYTAKALAELYAYVNDMPESLQKKKYVKQFNKENGNGTPLAQQKKKRSRSRTVDSIKKHFRRSTRRKDHDAVSRSSSLEKLLSCSSTVLHSQRSTEQNSKVLHMKNATSTCSHPNLSLENYKQVEINRKLFVDEITEMRKRKLNNLNIINSKLAK